MLSRPQGVQPVREHADEFIRRLDMRDVACPIDDVER